MHIKICNVFTLYIDEECRKVVVILKLFSHDGKKETSIHQLNLGIIDVELYVLKSIYKPIPENPWINQD